MRSLESPSWKNFNPRLGFAWRPIGEKTVLRGSYGIFTETLGRFARVLNNGPFQLSELYDTLQGSIWSELKTGREVTPMRRNLQREHLRRVAGALLRPSGSVPADARSLQRMNAIQLASEIRSAQAKPGFSKETKAHLAESLNTLDEALKAPMQRVGV